MSRGCVRDFQHWGVGIFKRLFPMCRENKVLHLLVNEGLFECKAYFFNNVCCSN